MVQRSFLDFARDQYRETPLPEHVDLSGKTVVLVGANTGIGFEATKHFANMNPARLILACRSESRGTAALEKLRAQTGYKDAELWILDLANYQSVIAFIERFNKEGGRLDYLVENAAVAPLSGRKVTTKDGAEEAVQVNFTSVALLGLGLLPAMVKTAQNHKVTPRLVVVSSEVHHWIKPKDLSLLKRPNVLEYLSSDEGCTTALMKTRYELTKFLEVLFIRELNDRLSSHGPPPIVVDTVNPGFCYSELRRDASVVQNIFFWMFEKLLARTSEQGSRELMYAALGGKDEDMRGEYISNGATQEVSDVVLSTDGQALQKQLWDEMFDALANTYPTITQIAKQYL